MNQLLLVAVVYVMAAPVLAGAIVTALLTMPGYTSGSIGLGALAGAVIALPVAWLVSKRIVDSRSS